MKHNYKNRIKGQSLIELALVLPLIFLFVVAFVDVFLKAHNAKSDYIEGRNIALKKSRNAKSGYSPGGEAFIPEMGDFDIPGSTFFDLPGLSDVAPYALSPLSQDLMDKLGLESTQSWWKSGLRVSVDSFWMSSFQDTSFGWNFLRGATMSGDTKNALTGKLGNVIGTGVQGTLTGAIASRDAVFNGQFGSAIRSGLSSAYGTDEMQSELSKAFGERDFFISTADGAIVGALSGNKDAIAIGAARGAFGSSMVQGNVAGAMGDRDYLVDAANITAYNVIGGHTDAIFTNAARAAFMSESVQRQVFGENPSAFLQRTGNAAASGGLSAIETGNLNSLYYPVGAAAAGELINQAVRRAYPDPEPTGDLEKDAENMKSHMESEQFASNMATAGILILAGPETVGNVAASIATSAAVEKARQELKSDEKKDASEGEAKDTQEDASETDDSETSDETSTKTDAMLDGKNIHEKLNSQIDREIKLALKNDNNILAIAKPLKTPLDDNSRNYSALFASNASVPLYKTQKKTPSQKNPAKPQKSSREKPQQPAQEEMTLIIERIETMSPDEVVESRIFKEMQSKKRLAKRLLLEELKRQLKIINSKILIEYGFYDSHIKNILSSRQFESALKKVMSRPEINSRAEKIVEYSLNKENIKRAIERIQERIVTERALFTELAFRKAMTRYKIEPQRKKEKGTFEKFIERIKNIFS